MSSSKEVHAIIGERQSNYGDFYDFSILVQKLKDVVQKHPNWPKMSPHHKEGIEMILHKLARSINGNPDYLDSYVDVKGYAQCIINSIEKELEQLCNNIKT